VVRKRDSRVVRKRDSRAVLKRYRRAILPPLRSETRSDLRLLAGAAALAAWIALLLTGHAAGGAVHLLLALGLALLPWRAPGAAPDTASTPSSEENP
jgi:hypothetical protein